MGDVPLLEVLSDGQRIANVSELVRGVANASRIAFQLDGSSTRLVDMTNVTDESLTSTLNDLFSIRCPSSLNRIESSSSIVYLQDFENNCRFDERRLTEQAFCGQCSSISNVLVSGNSRSADLLCFAYRILNSYVNEIVVSVRINDDTTNTFRSSIEFNPVADRYWHYTCVDVRRELSSRSSIYSSSTSFVIVDAWINRFVRQGLMIDTISLRTSLPIGYEERRLYPIDKSSTNYVNGSCVFPFYYNGQLNGACTSDPFGRPVCADENNQTYPCQSTSIEGLRRLFPRKQILWNSLKVNHNSSNSTVRVSFRYNDCSTSSLISVQPTSVSCCSTRLKMNDISCLA